MYTLQPEDAKKLRAEKFAELNMDVNPEILDLISEMMEGNPLARTFQTAAERVREVQASGKEVPAYQVGVFLLSNIIFVPPRLPCCPTATLTLLPATT